jgi:hypothetical protein
MFSQTSSRFASIILLISLFLAQPILAVAQEITDEEIDAPAIPANTVSCFDYYSFGSVQVHLNLPTTSTVSGANLTFTGTIENKNPYPIVGGALYIKVFKDRGATNDGNGPDVVDQFFVQQDVTLPANGSAPVSFTWRVPSHAVSGDYRVASFFTSGHKFNLLGLSFTDDVVGNTLPFKVLGEQEDSVTFDKKGVRINGNPYLFAAFPPHLSATEPAVVTARVVNTSDTDQKAKISWNVYQWDAQLQENRVQGEETEVTVPANGSAPVTITVTDDQFPVYLIVGTLTWNDTKSIIGARFVREGLDRLRINFPSVMAFPLVAGQENTLFSCLHNTGDAVVPEGRIDLRLKDREGNVISEYRYDGDITGAMMGVASKFIPTETYDYFTLDAELYSAGTLVDQTHMTYDCKAIDPELCEPETNLWIMLAMTAGLAAAVILLLFIKRKLSTAPTEEKKWY